MTSERFTAIEVVDLTHVMGGVDKQTRAAQDAIAQATSAMKAVAKAVAPKDDPLSSMMSMLGHRGSGRGPRGPSSAPALPPTSTLTR